jgi:uncharacterized protein (TIGR03437 family)
VTAISANSITLQFVTYGAASGGGGPTISRVTNNSSDIPAGFPNGGISQGALFKVVGTGLADDGDATLHDSTNGLPTLLNNAKITVTVGSVTVTVALYYATPTQIDGVMPASMPTGSGTLTVTHNGTASAAFAIVVVTAAPGITTYQNGTAVAQDFARPKDAYGGLITFLKSGVPGGIITIWGSGFGATGNSDTTYDTSGHQTSVSYSVYIGGVLVTNIAYKGAAVYPGVSIFVLTIPQNVPTGCYVPIAAVSIVNGVSTVSNIATLPINAGGGICSDPQYGITGDQLSNLGGQTNVKTGGLNVTQGTSSGSGMTLIYNNAGASFYQFSGVSYAGGGVVSIGGCLVIQSAPGSGGSSGGTPTGLDAGTITVTPPGGSPVTLTSSPGFVGSYGATLSTIVPGAYVFNGAGGTQVGKFSATVNFPNPLLSWTNQAAAANVSRSQGLLVTWSGGAPGSSVYIIGSSFLSSGSLSGTFICVAPVAAGQFTVPSYVLLSMPAAAGGSITVENMTNAAMFNASGIDFGTATGIVAFAVTSNYN